MSSGTSYTCSDLSLMPIDFLDKNDPSKIDTITAGLKMAASLIVCAGGATGSALTLPAAATAIFYGILYDEDLVDLDEQAPEKRFAIPATRIAEKLGVKIAANIVMLGFFSGNSDVIDVEAVKRAVMESVPTRFRKINEKAF